MVFYKTGLEGLFYLSLNIPCKREWPLLNHSKRL